MPGLVVADRPGPAGGQHPVPDGELAGVPEAPEPLVYVCPVLRAVGGFQVLLQQADLPVDVIEANIASAIDLVVQMRRSPDGSRRVSDVVGLTFDHDERRCITVPYYRRAVGKERGVWEETPGWVDNAPLYASVSKEEVEQWKEVCSLPFYLS